MLLDQAILADVDYYEVLGLTPEATVLDIEAAFKEKSAGLNLRHPDENERVAAAEQMLTLTQAYETLSDAMLRSHYDRNLLGRQNLPIKDQVENLFKEGIRAYRQRQTDTALRLLKEVTRLYPHRPLYRVHLAIAYSDKQWQSFTESELETALRLDPDFRFAKETIAKLLFKLPDRQNHWYKKKLNQQVIGLTAALVFSGALIAAGVPQQIFSSIYHRVLDSTVAKPQNKEEAMLKELPADLRAELSQKDQSPQRFEIPYKKADFVPEGKSFDYSNLEAKTKVYYPEQKMVVLTYTDGSILTYRPQDLVGWKRSGDMPIMITSHNELIPSPDSLPLKHPDMTDVDTSDAAFPWWMFPEYGIEGGDDSQSGSTSSETRPNNSTQDTGPTASNSGTNSNSSSSGQTKTSTSQSSGQSSTSSGSNTPPGSRPNDYNPYGGSP